MKTKKYREMFSLKAKERWANGSMEKTRLKLSNLMKQRAANGELKGYNRSKAEDEVIKVINDIGIDTQANT